ncbi:MAG TPA: DUF2399 domain-containing protein [Solirubrobacteraceae bacterium]|nr:DUF2399 domain-containing protein [Solirubrobacteraceae bacterium]
MPLDPALHRTLVLARDRRERRGASGDASFTLENLSDAEALALDGLLSPKKAVLPATTRRFSVSALEAGLRQIGIDPREAYEAVGDGALRDRPAERAAAHRAREGFHEWLLDHPTSRARPAIGAWLGDAARQGRVSPALRPVIERALAVVDALPARTSAPVDALPAQTPAPVDALPARTPAPVDALPAQTPAPVGAPAQTPVQRSVLAARLIDDDPHALDPGTVLHSLVVALLAADAGLESGTPPRAVWAAWNVQVDSISSNVAALNLPLLGDGALAEGVRLLRGTAVILTHGQLSAGELKWPRGVDCFTCENPAILLGAEQALGTDCPPVICTGGRPSDAVRLLLSSLDGAGARIRHHGDFDDAGVQILRDLELRYGAVPWRFDSDALREALVSHGRGVPSPWPPTLEQAVRVWSSSFPEELVIDDLVADLRRSSS